MMALMLCTSRRFDLILQVPLYGSLAKKQGEPEKFTNFDELTLDGGLENGYDINCGYHEAARFFTNDRLGGSIHGNETLPRLRGEIFRHIQGVPLLRGGGVLGGGAARHRPAHHPAGGKPGRLQGRQERLQHCDADSDCADCADGPASGVPALRGQAQGQGQNPGGRQARRHGTPEARHHSRCHPRKHPRHGPRRNGGPRGRRPAVRRREHAG